MNKKSELILVVPRCVLSDARLLPAAPGVVSPAGVEQQMTSMVASVGQFLPRDAMELDETYKQIIPYMVFVHDRRVFVMQRSGGAGEQRLAHAYTLGIGGHVRASDLGGGSLVEWGRREFAEEIVYDGDFSRIELLGLVNDDTNAVGRVHVGLVYVLHATSDRVAVRSELKSGELMDRAACLALYAQMETWSQYVVDALVAAQLI